MADDRLTFLDAAQVASPLGTLARFELCTRDNETVGTLEGVLIDPPARCIRYFVVKPPDGPDKYLLAADTPVRIQSSSRTGCVETAPADLHLEPFDPAVVRPFTEEDAITAMFAKTAA